MHCINNLRNKTINRMKNSGMVLAMCDHSRLGTSHMNNYYFISTECENHCKQLFVVDLKKPQQSRFTMAIAYKIISITNQCGNICDSVHAFCTIYISMVQLQARGLHVARHNVFSGPRTHSGKIFKSEICWKACKVIFVSLNCLR